MRIKNYPNGNQYIVTPSGKWVRNFTRQNVPLVDLNRTISPEDHFLFINNEFENDLKRYAWIDNEKFYFPNIIIVSDGYGFNESHNLISKIKNVKDVIIIGVNGSLKKWSCEKSMSFYLINNPYEECLADLPRGRTPPRCIASCRTNYKFLNNYRNTILKYDPVNEKGYEGKKSKDSIWRIDDYRNPICAAINLGYKFNVEKLLLMFSDDCFDKERPGSVPAENGLWMYPQQNTARDLIDANIHWLNSQEYNEIKVGSFSKGVRYKSAAYIDEEEKLLDFFI